MPILVRAAVLLALGFVLIAVSYLAPERKSWLKEWAFPLMGVAGFFASYVAALALGATAARMVFAGHIGESFAARTEHQADRMVSRPEGAQTRQSRQKANWAIERRLPWGESKMSTPEAALDQPPQPENFPLAIAAGLGTAIVGAGIWAAVTVATEMELGIMAVAVGYVVGQAIRVTGHGRSQKFGILGAACGLVGCLLGNLLSAVIFFSQQAHIPVMTVFSEATPNFLISLMKEFTQVLDSCSTASRSTKGTGSRSTGDTEAQ